MDKKNGFFGGRNSNESQQSESDSQNEEFDYTYGREVNPPNRVLQQDNFMPLRKEDLDYLANYIAQILDQSISKQVQVQSLQSKNSGNGFEKTVLSYLEQLLNGITVTDHRSGQRYYSVSQVLKNQDDSIRKLDAITHEIQLLHQTVEKQTKIIEEQASIIKMQHESIVRYENDVIYKTQKDLIMELIGIADQLRYTLKDYRDAKDSDSLYKSIEDLTEWVDGSLQAVAVRQYVEKESKELDRKRQEIVETQDTTNPDEDGIIKSILPGYIWSVPLVGSNDMQHIEERPRTYEFLIRPEQVARLKYVKPQVHQIEQHELLEESTQLDTVGVTESSETIMVSTNDVDVQDSDEIQTQEVEKKSSWWDRW